jgi:crossover junction endodeoxyribonuclease RuvC
MIILGIDPGAKGGLAVVEYKPGELPVILGGIRMPTIMERTKTLVDGNTILLWVKPWHIDLTVLEWVSAMPKQGVTSSFSFGRATGAVETVARYKGDRVEWVSPAMWKNHFGLSKDKRASMDKAAHLFGESFEWTRKADDGIAEAALMTHWFVDKKMHRL